MLTTKRKGDLAELHVASLLLADPAQEVFIAACDDGHGADLALRSTRTGRWYSIQVKAAGPSVNPWVSLGSFRPTDEFMVAAVILDEECRPGQVYLIPGSAWECDAAGCLGRNDAGGKNGPYVEVRTTAASHRDGLARFAIETVLPTL